MESEKALSLVDLCIDTSIVNQKFLSDVGDVEFKFLEQILTHCTKEQLAHVEESTKGRDLSPVTDKFCKKFFEMEFGKKSTNEVMAMMDMKHKSFKWLKLYEAKMKAMEKEMEDAGERLKKSYQKVVFKQSRQVELCNKAPPSKKRSWVGENKFTNKVRSRFQNCLELRNVQVMNTMKKKTVEYTPLMKKPRNLLSG